MIYFWLELEVAEIVRKFIDWEYSSNLSLMSISSYVEYETGNIYNSVSKLQAKWHPVPVFKQ